MTKTNTSIAPVLTIITTVLNGEATLRQAIESVLFQKTENIEYIVIDGGSTDNSVRIIKDYEGKIDYWISEKDSGIFQAWNKGLAQAKGEYVAFLGSDDFYHPDALENYLIFVKHNPNIEYISSKIKLLGKHSRIIGRPWVWNEFRRNMRVAHVGSLHKISLYQRYGKYDESLRIAGDYEFLLRSGKHLKAGFLDVVSASMGGDGVSNNQAVKSVKEAFNIKIRHKTCSFPIAIVDLFSACVKVLLKKLYLFIKNSR